MAELVEKGWSVEGIEGLTAAKLRAQDRARESEYMVVVREEQTGRVVANYPPRKRTNPPPNGAARRSGDSDSLIKLRAANERLRESLENSNKKG